jgi:hypothetical protein
MTLGRALTGTVFMDTIFSGSDLVRSLSMLLRSSLRQIMQAVIKPLVSQMAD